MPLTSEQLVEELALLPTDELLSIINQVTARAAESPSKGQAREQARKRFGPKGGNR